MEHTTAGFWLSPQQKHLWSLQQQGGTYAVVSLVSVDGPLRAEKLLHALEETIARHEILHTVYRRQSGMKVPFQVVLENLRPHWEVVDLAGRTASDQQKDISDRVKEGALPGFQS